MTDDIFLAAFGLIVILMMIFALTWILKKTGLATGQLGFNKKNSKIEIVESRLLDGRNRLHHIRWLGGDYLITANQGGVTLVGHSVAEDSDQRDGAGKSAYKDSVDAKGFKQMIEAETVENSK